MGFGETFGVEESGCRYRNVRTTEEASESGGSIVQAGSDDGTRLASGGMSGASRARLVWEWEFKSEQ